MEKFKTNIYNIYELIKSEKNQKSLINTQVLSKQYLAYYIYRIITKYITLIETAVGKEDINFVFKLLRIPASHDITKPYPMAGKLTSETEHLDLIILGGLDMFEKIDNFLKTLNKKNKQDKYGEFYEFLEDKTLENIIKDLMNLQKLLPGISVPIIRPNYYNDNKL
jgi:hypothetical protein